MEDPRDGMFLARVNEEDSLRKSNMLLSEILGKRTKLSSFTKSAPTSHLLLLNTSNPLHDKPATPADSHPKSSNQVMPISSKPEDLRKTAASQSGPHHAQNTGNKDSSNIVSAGRLKTDNSSSQNAKLTAPTALPRKAENLKTFDDDSESVYNHGLKGFPGEGADKKVPSADMNQGQPEPFREQEPLKQLNTVVSHNPEVPRSFRAEDRDSKQQSLPYQRSFTDKKRNKGSTGGRNQNVIDKKTMRNSDVNNTLKDNSLSGDDSPPGSFIDDKSVVPGHDLKIERSVSPDFLVSPDKGNSPVRPPLTAASKQQYGINILQLRGSRDQLEPLPTDAHASLNPSKPSSVLPTEQNVPLNHETTALLTASQKKDREFSGRSGLDVGSNITTKDALTAGQINAQANASSKTTKKTLKSAMKIKTAEEYQALRRERTLHDVSVYSGRSRTKSKNMNNSAVVPASRNVKFATQPEIFFVENWRKYNNADYVEPTGICQKCNLI